MSIRFGFGEEGHIIIVSNDGIPQELDAIRKGEIDATVSQPADLYAKYALFYAKAAVNGESFKPGKTDHDSTIVDVGNGNLEDQLSAPLITRWQFMHVRVGGKPAWYEVSTAVWQYWQLMPSWPTWCLWLPSIPPASSRSRAWMPLHWRKAFVPTGIAWCARSPTSRIYAMHSAIWPRTATW